MSLSERLGPTTPAPPTDWARLMVEAIEIGNWRVVRYDYAARFAVHAQGEGAEIYVAAVAIASAMRWQALGLLQLAWDDVVVGARVLPRAVSSRQPVTGPDLVELTPLYARVDTLAYWAWRALRVAWREQQEILELETRLRDAEPHEFLFAVLIERWRWVDKDRWTWGPIVRDEGINPLPTRKDLLDRATDLRQYITPSAGDIRPSAWRRAGAFGGIEAAATRQLATDALVSWAAVHPLAKGIPVRHGRLRAYRDAKERPR